MLHMITFKGTIIAGLIYIGAVVIGLAIAFNLSPSYSGEKDDLHLIIFSQDPDTEVEFMIDRKHHTEVVDAGVTYISYKVTDPGVRYLAYGDKETPRVDKGRDGGYYSMIFLKPPGESVGE